MYSAHHLYIHFQGIFCSCVNNILMLFTDLANPKGNLKTSGFTVEERESFSTLLEENKLIDSFRHLYPEKKDAYSYWSYRSNARKNNKGWYIYTLYIIMFIIIIIIINTCTMGFGIIL